MSFLAPAFLFGLLAIGLPIAIHLLKKKRVQIIPWAAHRFLQKVVKQQQKNKRLEDLILLILRCLIFALLAFAFAQPILRSNADSGGDETGDAAYHFVLVDVSGSMAQTAGIASLLEQAVNGAREHVQALPGSVSVGLFFFADTVFPAVGTPTQDRAALERELAQARVLGRTTDPVPALRAAARSLEAHAGLPRHIVVFTDDQATAWTETTDLESVLNGLAEQGITVEIRSVGNPDPAPNLAVTSVRLQNPHPAVGTSQQLEAEIFNGGTQASSERRVTLARDGGPAFAEKRVAPLAPGESAQVTFTVDFDSPGWHSLTVQTEGSQIPFSRNRSVVVHVAPPFSVLILEGATPRDARYRPGLFLAEAFRPVAPEARSNYHVQVDRRRFSNINQAELEQYQLVVLAGVSAVPSNQLLTLESWVRQGGGLWVFPPVNAELTAYNLPVMQGLTGLEFRALQESGAPLQPAFPPYYHPITEIWNEASESLLSVRVNRYLEVAPLTTGRSGEPVLEGGDGSILLYAHAAGTGRVLTATFPPDLTGSNFPLTSAFVPLLSRGAQYFSDQPTLPSSVTPGTQVAIPFSLDQLGKEIRMTRPDAPNEQRVIGAVELREGSPVLIFNHADVPGLYRFYVNGEEEPQAFAAVAFDRAESDIRPYGADFTMAGEASLDAVGSVSGASARWTEFFDKWLYAFLFAFLLCLLVAESYLAQRYSRGVAE